MKKKVYGLLIALLVVAASCRKDDNEEVAPISKSAALSTYPVNLATDWQDLHIQLIKETSTYVPPLAARSLGYVNLALYEATVHGTSNQTLAGQLNGLSALPLPDNKLEYNWGIAANEAQAATLQALFPMLSVANKSRIEALRTKLASQIKGNHSAEIITRSEAFGKSIAEAILAYAKSDGGDNMYNNIFPLTFVPPVGIGFWEPLPNQRALIPSWAGNRTFVKQNATTNAAPPHPFSYRTDTDFFREAKEVYEVSVNMSPAQKEIALFWADGARTITPPGHHMNIATILIRSKQLSLPAAVEIYTKMGIALNDAFIGCWRMKYKYNLMRPITYIREAIDPKWSPLIATPPFPEYTSGHSSGAGAAAEVLKSVFGDEISFVDNTHAGTLASRTYKSITAYSNEASVSRIYGGIHFRRACEQGLVHGKALASNVLALKFAK